MKKYITLTALLAMLLMTGTSCVSTKKIVYFQDSDSIFAKAQRILQQYEMRVKPADQIQIRVTSSEPELLDVFRQEVVIGGSQNTNNINSSLSTQGAFTINNAGEVVLPLLGSIKVADNTCEEIGRIIEQRIIEKGIVQDPSVSVRLLNARVAVLGAVQRPGVVSLTSERNTLADVLAQCGDIDDTGLRYHVKLFREQNGQRQIYEMDMTKADVFQSPGFYMQQNDLIYVEPNKSKSIKSSAAYTFLGAGASIMAFLTTIISLVILLTK